MMLGKSNVGKQYWLVRINVKGFESTMLLYGTMSDMWNYMAKELGYMANYRYDNASKEDVMMAKKLGMKIYIC